MTEALKALVTTLTKALDIVREHSEEPLGIRLVKAELEAKIVERLVAGLGLKIELAGIDVGVDHESERVNTVTIELRPTARTAALGSDELEIANSITDLAKQVIEISSNHSADFSLGEFSLSLAVEVKTTGQLKVVVGGTGGSGSAHKVKLTFRKA